MNKLKANIYRLGYLGVASTSFLLARGASAVTVNELDNTGISNDLILGEASPEEIAISLINWTLGILALITVVVILIGGFGILTAAGNEEKIDKSKKILTAAIIALLIILAAWGLSVYAINNLLNFTDAGGAEEAPDPDA